MIKLWCTVIDWLFTNHWSNWLVQWVLFTLVVAK